MIRCLLLIRTLAGLAAVALPLSCAAVDETPPPQRLDPVPYDLIPGHERYIVDGERLEYSVGLLFLQVGTITFETRRSLGPEDATVAITCATAPTRLAAALSRYGGRSTSWIDEATMRPLRYVWNNLSDPPKRRYNEFLHQDDQVMALQIEGDDWDAARFVSAEPQDPCSMLVLLRFLDLPLGETLRLDVIEGDNRRIATIRAVDDVELRIDRRGSVAARRYTVRIDKLRDGQLTGEKPETDMKAWVSLDDRRVVLRTRGRMGGATVRIDLVERTAPSAPAVPAPGPEAPAEPEAAERG